MTIFEKLKKIDMTDIHIAAKSLEALNSEPGFCNILCNYVCGTDCTAITDAQCVKRIEAYLQQEARLW